VIVADNTLSGEMKSLILPAAESLGLELDYVHAPANNISIARNACLEAARATWIAFLDDDEVPDPHWLTALLEEAERGGWDAVVGPVRAIYPENAPRWVRQGDFHSARPVWVGGAIKTAYTGNIVFRAELVQRLSLRFRAELGKSGGEDEDFFYRFCDGGGRIGFSPQAVVREHVPAERARFRWLMRRNFRAGQSHGLRLQGRNRSLRNIFLAAGKAAACCAGALLWGGHPVRRNRFLTRASLHAGVVSRLLNFDLMELY
jgi:succinoglycan biosynthesis protein ExoM